MYSQKAQVAMLMEHGAPKVLPKDPTERLKLVAGVMAAMTEPPPEPAHTGTTKGGASTSGSARDQIPDPDAAPGIPAPMTPDVGGGDRPAPAAAALLSGSARPALPADFSEDGTGGEVRGGTRTPAP